MCGRYALFAPASKIREAFGADTEGFDGVAHYNIGPLQGSPVIRKRPTGERVVHLLRWGLIPAWSQNESIASKLINARAETVAEKPSFRSAFQARRCIVPASGFYEGAPVDAGQQPYFIYPADKGLFGFAGLWERWIRPSGESLDTFTVITVAANEAMKALHDRMPAILRHEHYETWLEKGSAPPVVTSLLRPCAANLLRMHPVSKAVGNVRNDTCDLMQPSR